MWPWLKSHNKLLIAFGMVMSLLAIVLSVRRMIKSRDDQIADLITKLSTSEQTREVEKGLFAKKVTEVEDLKDLLSKLGEENSDLAELVKKGQMDIIALNQLVIKWKGAYYAVLNGHQTEEPPVTPGDPARKRVDFDGPVGPMRVWGHTLTDPPVAYLNWEQVSPIKITVGITKNRDGTYSTIVDTAPPGLGVEVTNALLDLSSLRPKWYQRIWVDLGVDGLGDRGVSAGLSYRLDRWSLGASCRTTADERSCGLTAGFRVFR